MDLNSMKNFIISIFFLTSFYSYSQECSSFYLIRHAEKLRIDKTERNPKLNEKGILRAEKWKEVLKNINLDKIYSTNYNRTIETAKPTSNSQEVCLLLKLLDFFIFRMSIFSKMFKDLKDLQM